MTQQAIEDIAEVTPAVSRFEATHPVETYTIDGIRVWPMLRSWVALTRFLRTSNGEEENTDPATAENEGTDSRQAMSLSSSVTSLKRFAPLALKQIYWTARHRLTQWHEDQFERAGPWEWVRDERPDAAGRDVVLITRSNRRVPIDGRLWHTIADPLQRLLTEHGLTLSVWERGERRGPRRGRSARIGPMEIRRALEAEDPAHELGPWGETPDWFVEFRRLAEAILERPIAWTECLRSILAIKALANDFEGWLRRGSARCILIDTWYTRAGMAASLAARRVGIPSIDIQHGLQGPLHPAYAGWSKIPEGGYELIPQYQWVWGEAQTRMTPDSQRPTLESFIGGNLWVNLWRDGSEPALQQENARFERLRGQASVSILVTTQPVVDLTPIIEAVAHSPSDWCWLIRFHRGTEPAAMDEARDRFLATGHGSVHLHCGDKGPLYAAFAAADVHVTGFSTCAMEALAFGKPSVLIHPIGVATFATEIMNGTMFDATDCTAGHECLLRAIRQATKVSTAQCRDAANALASSSAMCREAFETFFSEHCRTVEK